MALPSPALRDALQGLEVLQRQLAGLEQIGDEQARRPAEQVEQVLDQPMPVLTLVDRRLEELRVADLLDLAQRAFLLQPVNERLHGGVGDALFVGEALQDLADGARSELPDLLQDSRLRLGKPHHSYARRSCYDKVRRTTTAQCSANTAATGLTRPATCAATFDVRPSMTARSPLLSASAVAPSGETTSA